MRRMLVGAAAMVTFILFVLPWAFMLVVSLAPEGAFLRPGGLFDQGGPAWSNYANALAAMGEPGRLFWNSMLIALLSVVGQTLVAAMAGYALAWIPFRGRPVIFALVLAIMMMPDQVTAVPRFLIFRGAGLVDTYWPLILPAVFGGAPFWPPFFIFLFRQYFRTVPVELVEAARLDGCGHSAIFRRIMLPQARPLLVTTAIFSFLASWNDLFGPLIYIMSPEKRTLTLALASFNRQYNTSVEAMMAAASCVLLPCVAVYFGAQRFFVRSVDQSGVKG